MDISIIGILCRYITLVSEKEKVLHRCGVFCWYYIESVLMIDEEISYNLEIG